jgi:HEPN domain-containing protein
MKERRDLVVGLLRKAASDEVAMDASLAAGASDAACFHAQQAAGKYLKAYLTFVGVEFPFTHNLAKLVELCATKAASFKTLFPVVAPLAPYAVELR